LAISGTIILKEDKPMIQKVLPIEKPTLEKVQKQFETWRNTRKIRGPIPEELWESAIKLSKDYSIGKISRALRLSHSDLKERVGAPNSKNTFGGDLATHFVEVNVTDPLYRVECRVEMEDHKGARMKMYMKGRVDAEELARIFWEKNR
jgi:hypothetical protein